MRKHHRFPSNRLFLTFRGSSGQNHATPAEVEPHSAVGLPLDQLEAVDLSLDLAAALGFSEGSLDGGYIAFQSCREGRDGGRATGFRFLEPSVEISDRIAAIRGRAADSFLVSGFISNRGSGCDRNPYLPIAAA